MPYKNFIRLINKMSYYAMTRNDSDSNEIDEFSRLIESEVDWHAKVASVFPTNRWRPGDVLLVDFGKNLEPEMSYKHPCLVLNSKGKYIYCLPITSRLTSNPGHINAFHPVLNSDLRTCDKNFALMLKSEYTFMAHDSVIKLNDIKSISKKRVVNKIGQISSSGNYFMSIQRLAVTFCFPQIHSSLFEAEKKNSKYELEKEIALFLDECSDLSELKLISINPKFSVDINQIDDTCKYIIDMKDSFNQHVKKTVTVVVKDEGKADISTVSIAELHE